VRRVVVTGLGAVTPLANGVENTWAKIKNSQSGIRLIDGFRTDDLAARVGGQVPTLIDDSIDDASELFNPNFYITEKDQKMMDKFIKFGVSAAYQAVKDSGYVATTEEQQFRSGVMIGSGIGGLQQIHDTSITLHEKGPRRVSPYFIVSSLINLISGFVSIRNGFKGPNHAVVTACATGAHAIGDAARLIQYGDADVMVAGGAEAALNRVGISGFIACRALSTKYNDAPETASRPWDKGRDGFVMGEGAGVVVLEEYEHAKKRGAKIYGELIGYGLSGDAYHVTAPAEDGSGAYRAMESALRRTGLPLESIDYINAHGTSTPLGDVIEVKAMKRLFKDHVSNIGVSSTKSATGHLLGAAGGIEAIFSLLAMRDGVMPPTLNLNDPDEGCDLNFVPFTAQEKNLNVVMSNSFGFGGTNASLIFKKI
jgi:3-oxoacyl-[acyl-carrier-protein] synthase II